MNLIEIFYQWMWYHLSPCADKYLRRPWTYVMRDFVNEHRIAGIGLICLIGASLAYLVYLCIYWIFLFAFYWLLVGHVSWGEKWKKGQQEYPQYIEPNH